MNETLKKALFISIFAIGLILIIIKNNSKKESLVKNAKYTIVKVLDAEVHGKNDTKFTFMLYDQTLTSYGKLLWRNERQSIIGKNVLLEYDSTNIKNNKIFININVPENISVPIEGWKHLPNWANE
ncbi:MAG: hypothetical protein QM564_09590 [Bergeyella sp.]